VAIATKACHDREAETEIAPFVRSMQSEQAWIPAGGRGLAVRASRLAFESVSL
jgi:hypothetical protein